MGWRCVCLTVGFLAFGCTLSLNEGEHGAENGGASGEGGQAAQGGGGSKGTCAAEALSPEERLVIYQKAKANVEASGIPFDASWWEDEAKFSAYMSEVYAVAGCVAEADPAPSGQPGIGKSQQALHTDDGPEFYCGPGHGLTKLTRPHVSQCMNELCKQHDACYSMCSGATAGLCKWNANTSPCDAPFLERIGACPLEAGTLLESGAVEFVARSVRLVWGNSTCGAGLLCPALGEAGSGVCSEDRLGLDCTSCLSETDRGSVCLTHACSQTPNDPICYAANCPIVSECFGGYGRGLPGAIPPKPVVADPDTFTWQVIVTHGVVPEAKSDGQPWDADAFGFDPPDPFVVVTTGGVGNRTAIVQDVFMWQSDIAVLVGQSASALRSGISFAVLDSDLVDDDPIGVCFAALAADDFQGERNLQASCDTAGLAVQFVVVAEP